MRWQRERKRKLSQQSKGRPDSNGFRNSFLGLSSKLVSGKFMALFMALFGLIKRALFCFRFASRTDKVQKVFGKLSDSEASIAIVAFQPVRRCFRFERQLSTGKLQASHKSLQKAKLQMLSIPSVTRVARRNLVSSEIGCRLNFIKLVRPYNFIVSSSPASPALPALSPLA